MGLTLSTLLGNYGITRAKKNKDYIASRIAYGKIIEKCDPYIQYCDDYCNEKNEIKLKREKVKFLRPYGISYDDYINCRLKESHLSERQKEALEKVEDIKIFQIDMEYLLSDCDEEKINNESKKQTIYSYSQSQVYKDAISKIITAIIFGLWTVDTLETINFANIIWNVIQVSIWLVFAFVSFFKNYSYVVDKYRNNVIIRKTNYLYEFYNLMNENPNRYKKEETREVITNKIEEQKEEDKIILLPMIKEKASDIDTSSNIL